MKLPEVLLYWRAYVSDISDDEFTVIAERQDGDDEEYSIVLAKSAIPESELAYLRIGAFLSVSIIATAACKGTSIDGELKVEFSKDTWTKEEIEDADKRDRGPTHKGEPIGLQSNRVAASELSVLRDVVSSMRIKNG